QTYVYSDGTHIAMPAQNIMVCLRQAGTQMILKKQKTYKELTQSGLVIENETCEFLASGGKVPMAELEAIRELPFEKQSDKCRELGFRLWAKRATIGKAKHVRVRPRFDAWEVKGKIHVVAPEITADILRQLFTIAGRV